MAHIVTVYSAQRRPWRLDDMSMIRWLKISEALARRGHQVDIATGEHKWRWPQPVVDMAPNLRRVPIQLVRWKRYDAVKTLFHAGWRTLERYGGGRHPFVIAKLGSVVGPTDMPGIYFYGRGRRQMYGIQERIARKARYVTVLSEPARDLWVASHGGAERVLLVPGAVDRELPPPGPDPYPPRQGARAVFSGNLYTRESQDAANRTLIDKLNGLGHRLRRRGIRLFVVGPGDVSALVPEDVTYLGAVPYQRSWDHLHHADVGILVAAGPFMHNNESTKLYHYLRAGLPVVSEAGFPNDDVVREAGLGFVVANGDLDLMAERVAQAATRPWEREKAVSYVLSRHTWDHRADIYDRLLRAAFPD